MFLIGKCQNYIFINVHIFFYFYSSPHFLFIISTPMRKFSTWFPLFPPPIPRILIPIPCIPTLIPCISIIPTLIPSIPNIPLIPFPNSSFWILQIAFFVSFLKHFLSSYWSLYSQELFFCIIFEIFVIKLLNNGSVICKHVSQCHVKHILKISMKMFLKR